MDIAQGNIQWAIQIFTQPHSTAATPTSREARVPPDRVNESYRESHGQKRSDWSTAARYQGSSPNQGIYEETAHIAVSGDHNVRLNMVAREDILWWHTFASQWNEGSMLWEVHIPSFDLAVCSDASVGGAAEFWVYPSAWRWPGNQNYSMPRYRWKSSYRWCWEGWKWFSLVGERSIAESQLDAPSTAVTFFVAAFDFWFRAVLIQGSNNVQADTILRNNAHLFLTRSLRHAGSRPWSRPL